MGAHPGPAHRYKGLPLHKHAVEMLLGMGVRLLRVGGSFVSRPCNAPDTAPAAHCAQPPDYYHWKNWRGERAARRSAAASWGRDLEGGWGLFEALDLGAATGVEVVVSTFAQGVAPEELAQLVEYCYGDASTEYGRKRIVDDGHPAQYPLRVVDCVGKYETRTGVGPYKNRFFF